MHESAVHFTSSTRPRKAEAWSRVELGDGWVAACRFGPVEGGAPVLAEVRVYPYSGELGDELPEPPEEWTPGKPVPGKGVTVKLLRSIPLALLEARFRNRLRELVADPDWSGVMTAVWGFTEAGVRSRRRRPGRNGRTEREFAEIARDYVVLNDRGSRRPVVDLATRYGLSHERVRDLLHEARRLELLTVVGPGRAGGQLTEKAQALLAERPSKRKPPPRGSGRGPTPGGNPDAPTR